jgi:hypothetical protein
VQTGLPVNYTREPSLSFATKGNRNNMPRLGIAPLVRLAGKPIQGNGFFLQLLSLVLVLHLTTKQIITNHKNEVR